MASGSGAPPSAGLPRMRDSSPDPLLDDLPRPSSTAPAGLGRAASTGVAASPPHPAGPSVSTSSFDGSVAYTLRVGLKDLSIKEPGASFSLPFETPFPGEWSVRGRVEQDASFSLGLFLKDVPHGCVGRDVKRTLRFYWVTSIGAQKLIVKGQGGPISPIYPNDAERPFGVRVTDEDISIAKENAPYYEHFNPATRREYLLEITFEGKKAPLIPSPKSLAKRIAGLTDKPLPNDICLVFPGSSPSIPSLRIWTRRDFLLRSSSAFEVILADSETDTAPPPSKRARLSPGNSNNGEDCADSDEETDEIYLNFRSSLAKVPESDILTAFHEVKITDASFATYKAVLGWLQTGHISFAPLTSACAPALPGAPKTRMEQLYAFEDDSENEDLPLPASSKAVYVLASKLHLKALKELALQHFRCFLRVETAALELATPVALEFEEIQDAVCEFVSRNLSAVEKTEAWKNVMGEIKRGEKPAAAGVIVKLWEVQRAKEPPAAEAAAPASRVVELDDFAA